MGGYDGDYCSDCGRFRDSADLCYDCGGCVDCGCEAGCECEECVVAEMVEG